MLGSLDHPRIAADWFSTTLLRWSDGLVIYDTWLLNFSGFSEWQGGGGEILLDFYYFCYLIAFIGVLFWFGRFRKQGWIKIKPHVAYDALLLAMIGVLVGAKTAYIFIYNPDFYFGPPPYGPVDTDDQLRRIFLNWSGMSSHGAAFGTAFMALVWWLRSQRKAPLSIICDVGTISAAFGVIWIRLANFMNGELYGREAPSWLPWAMRFPVRSGKGNTVVFADRQLWEVMPKPESEAQAEKWMAALEQANPGGVVDQGGSVLYRNPQAYLQPYEVIVRAPEGIQTVPHTDPNHLFFGVFDVVTTPRHPSQLYQLLLEGVLVLLLLLWLRRRVKRSGVVAAGFFTFYPIARFIGEFWRQPDVQFQGQGNELGTVIFGLSMGQLLSLGMAAFGVCAMIYYARFGRVIADMKMYPPEREDPKTPPPSMIETGMGGSTGAGEIAGIEKVHEALAKKQVEWDAEHAAEQAKAGGPHGADTQLTEELADDSDSDQPKKSE
ncbi:MAG: prolipoprotein diacylglyceryl transferase [Planctomycetes bacterium]|nr:prolipoprotein diacylglyceryl transferase [Planctomycetota bacterium]MCW8134110.1 prolipoprotein diacylglyceryl transferase [Planctomycetota bacterium]